MKKDRCRNEEKHLALLPRYIRKVSCLLVSLNKAAMVFCVALVSQPPRVGYSQRTQLLESFSAFPVLQSAITAHVPVEMF